MRMDTRCNGGNYPGWKLSGVDLVESIPPDHWDQGRSTKVRRWIQIDFWSLNPNQKSKMAKTIQQGRQRWFAKFSSARGAIPNSAEHNGGRVIFIFDNDRRHYYNAITLKKENRKNIESLAFGGISKFEISIFFENMTNSLAVWFYDL